MSSTKLGCLNMKGELSNTDAKRRAIEVLDEYRRRNPDAPHPTIDLVWRMEMAFQAAYRDGYLAARTADADRVPDEGWVKVRTGDRLLVQSPPFSVATVLSKENTGYNPPEQRESTGPAVLRGSISELGSGERVIVTLSSAPSEEQQIALGARPTTWRGWLFWLRYWSPLASWVSWWEARARRNNPLKNNERGCKATATK